MKMHIFTVGRLRGAYAELCADYVRRLPEDVLIREITAPTPEAEGKAILRALPRGAFVVVLDERGQDLSSRAFAAALRTWQEQSHNHLVFIIGGADGLTTEVKAKAGFLLGLGHKTWPHKLARVMLLEQIYRARQINAGHPYHRD